MNNNFMAFGNVVADPEQRKIKDDLTVTQFRFANNVKKGGKDEVLWVRCTVWGKLQDVVLNYVKKGSPLFVSGELSVEEWEKDGVKNYSLSLNVKEIKLLGGKNSGESSEEPAKQTPSKPTGVKTANKTATKAPKTTENNDDIPF